MKRILTLLLLTLLAARPWAQEVRFPYPAVPDTLTEPQARLGHLLEHFWDAFSFADCSEANTAVAEQGLADFISVAALADSATLSRAAARFAAGAMASPAQRSHYYGLIDHYLINPESPLRNDGVLAAILEHTLSRFGSAEVALRERAAHHLAMAVKNQEGTPATDFAFVRRDGTRSTLRASLGRSAWTVLLFYDPDCTHCAQQWPQLTAAPELQAADVQVIAVYPDADTAHWQARPKAMPKAWTDAASPQGELMAQRLYYLPAMPSLYLLDRAGRIVLKDAPLERVQQVLRSR